MLRKPKAARRNFRLTPQVPIDRSQGYFWTKRWQEGEYQAEKDIQ